MAVIDNFKMVIRFRVEPIDQTIRRKNHHGRTEPVSSRNFLVIRKMFSKFVAWSRR
jgi:hypothetical protein